MDKSAEDPVHVSENCQFFKKSQKGNLALPLITLGPQCAKISYDLVIHREKFGTP